VIGDATDQDNPPIVRIQAQLGLTSCSDENLRVGRLKLDPQLGSGVDEPPENLLVAVDVMTKCSVPSNVREEERSVGSLG